jgi:hypothetical protein
MTLLPPPSDMSHSSRLARYGLVSTALALLSDQNLGRLVEDARMMRTGIGGRSIAMETDGTPVFVKLVPLTDLERLPENISSTANIFRLPTRYHYGVGSAGHGAWRELATHIMTNGWVLGRQCESFPLMYHWRVVERLPAQPPNSQDRSDLDRMVKYWGNSASVRRRLLALMQSSADVVMFFEHVPMRLDQWLKAQLAAGQEALPSACGMVERSLKTTTSFMTSNHLLHFDAHFRNVLTDGQHLYFADFGLALSSRFDLSPTERSFFERNVSHDSCYVLTQLVNWLVVAFTRPVDVSKRNAYIKWCAEGGRPGNLPPAAASIVERYAPIAVIMNRFYWKLFGESRATTYPAADIRRAWAATGCEPAPSRSSSM